MQPFELKIGFIKFDPVTLLLASHDPVSNLSDILLGLTFEPSFIIIQLKM